MTDRELWLTKAAEIINREIIQSKGASLPEKWKISVGFPHGNVRAIGQAWGCENSSDGELILTIHLTGVVRVLNILVYDKFGKEC